MRESFAAAATAPSRRACGGEPSATPWAMPLKEPRSCSQRWATLAPGSRSRSRSSACQTSRHVGSSWVRNASVTRSGEPLSIAGASTSASKPGSVAGPAGGQISGSSASSGSPPVIHALIEARLASSSALCPLAQCRPSSSVAHSASDEPGNAARSAR